ncbi:hypothetical protein K0M31_005401 [Melipona bicolor]|uniref:Uncharacterized protein n=1 Tax=Melipona bicolor TaxID=60889 RepID=A0AA40FUY5_9HYME|nr:hypothetical protein K0M31_005401 [Melipona bicolor]
MSSTFLFRTRGRRIKQYVRILYSGYVEGLQPDKESADTTGRYHCPLVALG